jgi:hypothetical protein
MNEYLLDRLRCDASHVLELAGHESELQHAGMRGRFRELLIDNFLAPWLPPYVACGTGMIMAAENKARKATQDDIILYDRSLCPPIMASVSAPEGVFLYNSVLARIEVKSKVIKAHMGSFIDASLEIADLKFSVRPDCKQGLSGAFNLLFAFASDLTRNGDPNKELRRLTDALKERNIDPCSGLVSMLCVAGIGFWKVGLRSDNSRVWQRLHSDDPRDQLVWFLGCISNSCYDAHAVRQGREPSHGLEGGVGTYLPHPFEEVVIT